VSEPTVVKSLTTLVTLRERAVDRLAAEMAEKRQARERFERNLERLKSLAAGASAQGKAPALALNAAYYKQAVLQLADVHRVDLALHEADMAVTQKALDTAAQKREVLGQVLAREQQRVVDAQQKVEQRRQDELASLQWFRSTRS
jgi:flagellar export protein FliJ